MDKTDINQKVDGGAEVDEGAEAARIIAEESEFGSRRLSGFSKYLIPGIAAAWSLFQLSLPKVIMLDSVYIRCIHLAFAISLVYLSYPAVKKREFKGFFSFLSVKNRIHYIDYALAMVAAAAVLYLAVNYLALSERQGAPLPIDIIIGIVLVILLLEAARRSLGPFLVIIVLVFIFYSFFGNYMPDLIAFKGVSLRTGGNGSSPVPTSGSTIPINSPVTKYANSGTVA
jgi:TRAP-type uncharacterized transport system fused permease subunit